MRRTIDLSHYKSKVLNIHIYDDRTVIVLYNNREIVKSNGQGKSLRFIFNKKHHFLCVTFHLHVKGITLEIEDYKGERLKQRGHALYKLNIQSCHTTHLDINHSHEIDINGYNLIKNVQIGAVEILHITSWFDDKRGVDNLNMGYCSHINTMSEIDYVHAKYLGSAFTKRVKLIDADFQIMGTPMPDRVSGGLVKHMMSSKCIMDYFLLDGV